MSAAATAGGRFEAGRWLALGARLAFALAVVAMPFRARSPVLAMPPGAVPAVLVDLVIYAVDVLVVATLGLWLLARSLDRRPGRRRIGLGPLALRGPVVALVGLAWLTIPFGIEPGLSVVGAVRITVGALLALYILNEVEGLAAIAVPVAAMLTIQAAVGIAQVVTGGPLGLPGILELPVDPAVTGTSVVTVADGSRVLRAYGLSLHPNVLGGFLACGLVILMAVSTRSPSTRLARAGVVAIAAAALVVTFSRSAWLAGLAGLIVGLAMVAAPAGPGGGDAMRLEPPMDRRPALHADRHPARSWLATAGLVLGVTVAVGWLAREPIASRALLGPSVVATEQRSIDERLEQIRLGWEVVVERPLSGVGASALPLAMRRAEPDFRFSFYAPHLVALVVAGELGIFGGLAYVALMAAPWVLLTRTRRRWTVELAGASAALAALTVVSLFDDYPWVGGPGRTLAWFVLGLWAMAWTRAMPASRTAGAIGPLAASERGRG